MSWREMLLTFFGAGKSPKAPGTVASLAASLLVTLLCFILFDHLTVLSWNLALLAACGTVSLTLVALGPWAVRYYGTKDPQRVVLDEVAGVFLTMVFVPIHSDWRGGLIFLVGFAAFRAFDITKPPPCGQLEKLPDGWGILCDDLMAGVYANVVCQVVSRLI